MCQFTRILPVFTMFKDTLMNIGHIYIGDPASPILTNPRKPTIGTSL